MTVNWRQSRNTAPFLRHDRPSQAESFPGLWWGASLLTHSRFLPRPRGTPLPPGMPDTYGEGRRFIPKPSTLFL